MSDASSSKGRWRPGQSGNPAGKAPGSGALQKLRTQISQGIPQVLDRLLQAALQGDVQAARLLLDRVLPPLRPVEVAEPIAMGSGSLTERAERIVAGMSQGHIAAATGRELIAALSAVARVMETDELAARMELIERKMEELK